MPHKEKTKLEDFSLSQLHILLNHLRLGVDHLKFLLTPKQLKELFTWWDLDEEQKKQIYTDKIETLGNMSLIINTILTSTFGAWMGLSGCIGCGLGSVKMLTFISLLAFIVSGIIGYLSLRMTRTQARTAIQNQIIHHLQLRVNKIINKKMLEKQDAIAFYLNTAVSVLENKKEDSNGEKSALNSFSNFSEAYGWYEKLITVLNSRLQEINEASSTEVYHSQVQRVGFLIKKTLAKYFQFLESLVLAKKQEQKRLKMMPTYPFLKVLTHPSFGVFKYQAMNSHWTKRDAHQLLLGLVPTIWGGFASMFVFVGGIPTITKELNFLWLSSVLTTPLARVIEITLAVLVTCYFAFAFFYSSKKNWQREQWLDQIEKEIASEETKLLENGHKLNMLSKIRMHVQKLISSFTMAKKLDQNLGHLSKFQINSSIEASQESP
jgi:hypothetical protein